uniref:PDZ domain-containing protein n=1 Tax=Rhizochromulina marina TaxID=1034831 RepID=A0A7S2RL85_9STRA|mmetsp:Transcript_17861/g.52146  ORF Transcript_17861/g.52146 Transcript_17861/m.52146 type:complete len:559 (+) Transcript_17861:25-1701(+)
MAVYTEVANPVIREWLLSTDALPTDVLVVSALAPDVITSLGVETGSLRVEELSPALTDAGLRVNDIVLEVDGTTVSTPAEICTMAQGGGDVPKVSVKLKVKRWTTVERTIVALPDDLPADRGSLPLPKRDDAMRAGNNKKRVREPKDPQPYQPAGGAADEDAAGLAEMDDEEEEEEEYDDEEEEVVGGRAKVPRGAGQSLRELGTNKVVKGKIPRLKMTVGDLEASNHLLWTPDEAAGNGPGAAHKAKALFDQFASQGYIMLRKFMPEDAIAQVKSRVSGVLFQGGGEVKHGVTVQALTGDLIEGKEKYTTDAVPEEQKEAWRTVGTSPELSSALAGDAARLVFRQLAAGAAGSSQGGDAVVFHPAYTWLRAKAPSEQTPEHADYYYFASESGLFSKDKGQAAEHLAALGVTPPATWDAVPESSEGGPGDGSQAAICGTLWMPLEDVPPGKGVLGLIPGSHLYPGVDKRVGDASVPASYLKSCKGGTWLTTDFKAGDLVLFDMRTIHATSKNHSTGNDFRFSCDTRWCIPPKSRASWSKTVSGAFINALQSSNVAITM